MSERDVFAGGEFLIRDFEGKDVFTPEDFSEEHRMIRDTAREFVKNEVEPNVEQIEQKDQELITGLLAKAGEIGLLSTGVPEAYGGLGLDNVCSTIVTETLGSAGSFSVVHSVQTGIGSMPIVYFGSEEQKKKYLPEICQGTQRSAYALTEAMAGSDALSARTKAVLSDDGKHYIMNGEKIFITSAGIAHRFVVYAKIDGEHFTGFIVDADAPGVSLGREEDKMGVRGSSTTAITFDDAKIPVENMLFEAGKGHKIAFNVLNLGRFKLGAAVVGGAKNCVRESVLYANERQQFDKPISSFSLVKDKLAEMAIRTYMGESMMYRIAGLIDDCMATLDAAEKSKGEAISGAIGEYAVECSIAKVYGSELLDFCVDNNVQIHGGYGYMADYNPERRYRDSRINRIWEGTNEINRMLIPGTLLRRAMAGKLALMPAAMAISNELLEYSPLSLELPDTPLAVQEHMLKMAKKLDLMVSGVAAMKFQTALSEEQEVLAGLADITLEIFALESGLVRALKLIEAKGAEKAGAHINAVKSYVNDLIPKLEMRAKQLLAYISEGDELRTNLAAVKKLMRYTPLDGVTLKRTIADEIIRKEDYPF